ncbi:photosynthetic complex assembly protein PuhC [Jannaschia sp. LMIT008]|uniref:photosynthetic complex assembly protein PuhC n=1 Tax=Jannaschia maritima TaxID=3032585 RepID=UPI0028110369|nr:photosynthetic complex assembly protein PuhC [Jannaschia sp. LMIT008]
MTPENRLRARDREMVPTVLLRALATLVVCALFIVGYARLTDRPLEAMPVLDETSGVAAQRSIFIDADGTTGAARVLGADGTVIASFDAETGGFVAGVHRALTFERTRRGADVTRPVRLIRFDSGQLSLRDDTTGWRAELIGFGADNAAVFARLLD